MRGGERRGNRAICPEAQHQTHGSSSGGENKSFCNPLAHELESSGPEGGARGHFPLPHGCAREKKVGHIHAGDQEGVTGVSDAVIASGACDEVRRRARDFTERAVAELAALGPSPARQLLETVAYQLVERIS